MKPHTLLTALMIMTLVPIGTFGRTTDKGDTKGILPELKIDSNDESANQKKALQSEALITKTENQAVQYLLSIIAKKKGTPMEADLWFRLAELYMRRTKSGRFFDMNRDQDGPVRFLPPEITGETASASLKRAIQVYTKIEKEFPKFPEMDAVYFNNAFASQQLRLDKNAQALYQKVVTQFPRSSLVPDSLLALGEMAYERHAFKDALDSFLSIERFPTARVYSYGMYKAAWTLYNLHQNDEAIQKMMQVARYHDPKKSDNPSQANHNLRSESLRDLTIFYGETQPAEHAYEFFARVGNEDEIADCIYTLGKLYDSHSRQKEMNVFLKDLVRNQPNSKLRVKIETLMILGNETSRARADALKHLQITAELCQKTSTWRAQNPTIAETECDYDFAKTNVEMAKKWWDLWQKNKTATQANEIAGYALEAFRIHLDREDPSKPDTKSHYAYAELLYQLGNYRKASEQYEFSGTKSADTQTSHDACYSAIVSLEKAKDLKKENLDDANVVRLSQIYLDKFPKGEHAIPLRFKIGHIAYEQNNLNEAEKWLKPLALDLKSGEFKRKSEDLMLDIYNSRKDFSGIKTFAAGLLKQSTDDERKSGLTKIIAEADYSEIQELVTSGKKVEASQRLVQFFNDQKTSSLRQESLWQGLSLYYSEGRVLEAAETTLLYAKNYPNDKRTVEALKDAVKAYTDSGLIVPAAETLKVLAGVSSLNPVDSEKYTNAAVELYLLDGQTKTVQDHLRKQLTETNKKNHGKIYAQLLSTMKGQEDSAEYKSIEDKIVGIGFEPNASEIKVRKIEAVFNAGKMSDAFNMSKSLVGADSSINENVRARARLVQAKVLEKEFIETKTKTSVEKLALVLSIKTERLDKAQTAFLTAAKIATDVNVKLQALQGLNRIYTNYVDSVGHPSLKDEDTLTNDDKKALAEQLAKLTAPMLEKKVDTDKQLQKLAKDSKATSSTEVDYANLPVEETIKPRIPDLKWEQTASYLPVLNKEGSLFQVSRYEGKNEKCLVPDAKSDLVHLVDAINPCVVAKNQNQIETIAMQMIRLDPKSGIGPFYLSLLAEFKGQLDKADWLMDLALKKNPETPFMFYQKAKIAFQRKDFAQSNSMLVKAFDLGIKTEESTLIHGTVNFAQGDCLSALADFAKFDKKTLAKFKLAPAISECHALKGDFEKALGFIEDNKSFQINSDAAALLWLQLARVQETYRFDSQKALPAYESALKLTQNHDLKDWIQRKLDFIRGKHTLSSVGQTGDKI